MTPSEYAPRQELMTPEEAARWFRRSTSWLRRQRALLRLGGTHGQPLFHVEVCRAYVLGQLAEWPPERLRQAQLDALAAACGLSSSAPNGSGVSSGHAADR